MYPFINTEGVHDLVGVPAGFACACMVRDASVFSLARAGKQMFGMPILSRVSDRALPGNLTAKLHEAAAPIPKTVDADHTI